MDVHFYEIFKEEELAVKKFLPKNIKAAFTSKTIQEEGSPQPPASLISIRTQSHIPEDWAPQLKGILTRSAGYDHLKEYQVRTGVVFPLGYLPDYCSRAVAEQAILSLLSLMRKFTRQLAQFHQFNRDGITGEECQGKKLLILGVGRIGREVAGLGQGLAMQVKGVDIDPKLKSVEHVPLDEGLAWADAVICALPLTEKTRKLLNYAVLKDCRPGVFLVNISRGEITPPEDLKRLLDEEHLAGLALDVFPDEGRLAQALRAQEELDDQDFQIIQEFKAKDNVLLTPHNAFNTQESVLRKAQQSIESIKYFLKNQTFPDIIPD